MVQIEPTVEESPAQQVAVGSSGVDSQAITQESMADDPADAGKISDAHGFSGESSATSDPARPEWQSERTRRTRQVALVTLVSATGLMAAIVVFVSFVRSFRQPVAQQPEAEVAEPIGDVTDEPTVEPADGTDADAEALADAVEPARPDPDRPDPDRPDPVSPDNANQDDQVAATDNGGIPNDLIPQSPLDMPTQPDASALLPSDPLAADEDPDAEAGGLQALPPELEKYLRFLPNEGQTEQATLPKPPSMDDIDIDGAAAQDFNFLGRAAPKELNLTADLGIRLALASDGYVLADLMLLVSQATGVPIQVDWVSFDLAGVEIERPVDAGAGWQSARQLLDRVAASIGGEIRAEKTLVILTLTDETFQGTMDRLTDLQDFGAGSQSATQVLNTFLGGNPQARKLELGDDREKQQLAGLAIEGLRRMRGVTPKVTDAAMRRWAGGVEDPVDWPIIVGGQAGPQFDSPIAFASLLRRMGRRNQSICIVNWYDAISRGAAPEFTVMPHIKQDAALTMEKALEPFELQVRQVDSSHWWVGSEPTYDRLTAVVWTQPLGNSKERFLENLDRIMQGESTDVYRVAYDEASDRALMLLPRFIVRQLTKITPSIAAK